MAPTMQLLDAATLHSEHFGISISSAGKLAIYPLPNRRQMLCANSSMDKALCRVITASLEVATKLEYG